MQTEPVAYLRAKSLIRIPHSGRMLISPDWATPLVSRYPADAYGFSIVEMRTGCKWITDDDNLILNN